MPELEEFAEALLDQLAVEASEEAEIASLSERIRGDPSFDASFEPLEAAVEAAEGPMREEIASRAGLEPPPGTRTVLAGLGEFKRLKGAKVAAPGASRAYVDELFAAVAASDRGRIAALAGRDLRRFLVYSTYAKSYLSSLSTTYGDYFGGSVYLNRFVLDSYPQIILYKQGPPYRERSAAVRSGYAGALKMTVLEETAHACQGPLHEMNAAASLRVNELNEELAGVVEGLGEGAVGALYEHLQLQSVPDGFPVAKRANLFFMLNPDNFIVNVLGPDVMTYTRVEIDPKISSLVPELLGVYERWLPRMQEHHAAFTVMEGMAAFLVDEALGGDEDFGAYLSAFAGTDASSYRVRKDIGRDFVRAVHAERGRAAFRDIMESPPTTRELKDPAAYLGRARGVGGRFDPFLAEWASVALSPGRGLVEKCLKTAQMLEHPGLDVSAYAGAVDEMGRRAWALCRGGGAAARVRGVNSFFFGALEFGPDEDYYHPRNNFLNEVVDRRAGIPVTLSVLYAELARAAGLPARVIAFPGRVLVGVGGAAVVDPYGGGRLAGPAELQSMLDGAFGGAVRLSPSHLAGAGDARVLARIARNLKGSYMSSYDYGRASRCAGMALALEPGSAEDMRDRGIAEARLLNRAEALEWLGRYLDARPDGEDVDAVLEVIRGIRARGAPP